jgi:hypothetical protein
MFTRVAKPVIEDGKPVFHQWIPTNSPAAVNPQQVLKLALLYLDLRHDLKESQPYRIYLSLPPWIIEIHRRLACLRQNPSGYIYQAHPHLPEKFLYINCVEN